MTPDEARARLLALGLDADAAEVMFDHFADSERRGKLGHGFSRIPWLETQGFDLDARPVKGASSGGVEHWDANGALGYLTLAAICDDVIREGVVGAKLVVAVGVLPDGRARVLGPPRRDSRVRGGADRHVPTTAPAPLGRRRR